ncbi:hypothetical protein RclHR1_01840015 [Rhizophagus clarus]|uniref:Uncharacterized protein n=1 Tax=Rhizophagus clarus TaxID=94130 RepID=A0A2Z6RFG2_9GLOM|nr:hypothetical protein RclHR1_01840015 [Rhizophagus clarus]
MIPKQQKEQFIRGLNPMNQYNIRMMAKFYDTQDNITKALAEAEKYTLFQMNAPSSIPVFLAANPYVDTNRSGGGMTKNEIEDLIKTTMASSQPQQNTDLQSSIKSLQETMSRVTKTLDNGKKSTNKRGEDLVIRRFLSELLRTKSNKQPEDDYNYDPVDDITDSMAGMTLNSVTIDAINSAVRSAVKKCTKCGRFGHTSHKSEKHDLSGVATVPIESIGIVRNLPITLAPGCTIHEDFVVVDYHKPTLIFSNQLLKKYGCAVDWNTNELKIPLNGKDYIIPVTMHKVKNKLEVNCATTTSECDDLPAPDKVSQDSQDSSERDILKKK